MCNDEQRQITAWNGVNMKGWLSIREISYKCGISEDAERIFLYKKGQYFEIRETEKEEVVRSMETTVKNRNKAVEYASFVLLLILSVVCIFSVTMSTHQASLPIPMPQEFIGEYSYDGETWQPLTEDAELSALKGDLFLRGTFLREMREGWQLNFYRNHIGVSIKVNGEQIYKDAMLYIPDLQADTFASMCAREWMAVPVLGISTQDTVEIYLHNPHAFGNKTAYRDFLTTLCSDMPIPGLNILQQNLDAYGEPLRITGGLLAVASLMLLGAAIAAAIVRIPVAGRLLKLGLLTLFTGGFIAFDTIDISFWNELNVLNTYTQQLCMMLAVFCLDSFICDYLTGKRRKAAGVSVAISAALSSVLIILSFTRVTALFDTLSYWAVSQAVLCPVLMVCCVGELLKTAPKGRRLVLISGVLLPGAILLDLIGVGENILCRCVCSKVLFIALFVVHIIAAARGIVLNHQASIRAKKLEKELEESRISVMLSQIQPHFLYNVLGTIRSLCRKDPERAWVALGDFSKYLQGNMSALKNNRLIRFDSELRYIETYLKLEKLRLEEKLSILYDVQARDFMLPPLTIQPLVENAVKHGIFDKPGGGTVVLRSRQEADSIIISVEDNGIGFDPEAPVRQSEEHAHVGLVNVRSRLEKMVGGQMTVQSTPGKGTTVTVRISTNLEINGEV